MIQATAQASQVQKKTEQVATRQPEQGPVQPVAPQVAYRRAQVSRNGLRSADLLALQRTVGNRQLQRIVARRIDSANGQQLCAPTEENHEIKVQTKLTVSATDDIYAQEADHMIEPISEEGGGQARKETVPPVVARLQPSQGKRQPLPETTPTIIEPRLGHNFGQVHLRADTSDMSLVPNPQPFVHQQDMSLGVRWHSPKSQEGDQLLAPELTYAIHHDGAEPLNKDVRQQANESEEDEETPVQTKPQVQRQVEPAEKNSGIAQGECVQRQTLSLWGNDAKAVARQLLEAAKQGRLVLQKRDLQQISQIAKTGMVRSEKGETVVPSDALVSALQSLLKKTLAHKGGSKSQLGILSLVRFVKKSGHSRGEAVDIHVYGGYSINMGDPKSALNGTLAVISDLPSGCYALGIPRTLPKDKDKLFFPAGTPQYESPSHGRIDKDIEYIEDTRARDQFRKIIKDAANRGAIIRYLFPDARDHLHIQLVPCPTLPPGKKG